MTSAFTKTAATLIAVTTAVCAVPARADESLTFIAGYGQLYQTRQGVDSSAHLGMIGAAGRFGDDLFGTFDLQFGIDSEYSDFSHISIEMMVGYALGPEAFTFWIGGGARFALDGYPNPSASIYDPGLGVGFFSLIGDTVGIGADMHAFLGWNFYSDRRSDDISMTIEPYIDWRLFIAVKI